MEGEPTGACLPLCLHVSVKYGLTGLARGRELIASNGTVLSILRGITGYAIMPDIGYQSIIYMAIIPSLTMIMTIRSSSTTLLTAIENMPCTLI